MEENGGNGDITCIIPVHDSMFIDASHKDWFYGECTELCIRTVPGSSLSYEPVGPVPDRRGRGRSAAVAAKAVGMEFESWLSGAGEGFGL